MENPSPYENWQSLNPQKPTANLLIITYLQRPWGRRSCKNTFDIVYTQMFFFCACCDEVSLRQWMPLLHVSNKHTAVHGSTHPPVPLVNKHGEEMDWIGGLMFSWWLWRCKHMILIPRSEGITRSNRLWHYFEQNQTKENTQQEKKTEALNQKIKMIHINTVST